MFFSFIGNLCESEINSLCLKYLATETSTSVHVKRDNSRKGTNIIEKGGKVKIRIFQGT